MTTHKDFKRIVRARMQKAGESYTSARARLLATRRGTAAPAPGASAPPAPRPADYARLAGMSDATIKAKTGCTWERWVRALDYVKAHEWSHRAIAEYVHDTFEIPGWWSQMVTVGYERIKGRRAIGQRVDGRFSASKSKTFAVPLGRLYRAWQDRRTRARWLAGVDLTIRRATKDRAMRITWPDGTSVEVWFVTKGRAKSQLAVEHTKLADRESVDRLKTFWAERLAALGAVLAQAS